jgi:hypothetical protein
VDHGDISDGDAPGQDWEDVPLSLDQGAGARSGNASAPGEPREAAEGRFLGGGGARPVHNTAQYPFQDVMAQRGMCSEGRAPHPMVDIGRAEVRATVGLHGRRRWRAAC